MVLTSKKYWLFDMDGTLTCAMHDFDAMREALGLPEGEPILEALDAMEPSLAAQKHRELDAMELDMAAQATPQPGSHDLLKQLQELGYRLGIVTRNGKEIAKVTLQACGLMHFFTDDDVISRDCCEAKPDPAGINLLLYRWNADPREAVMVGDYLFDLEAGRNAGITTVHLDVNREFLWPNHTDYGVGSLTELSHQLAT